MIGKKVSMGRGFRGAFNYAVRGSKTADAGERHRVRWMAVKNLADPNPEHAPRVMRWTAEQNTRVKDPLLHLVVTWGPDEEPTDEAMQLIADRHLADLELAEHQAVVVAHDDTKHPHMHLIVNRVHPVTGKAWSTSQDYRRIEQSMGELAIQQGFQFVEGRHNTPENRVHKPRRAKSKEYQMARRTRKPPRLRFSPADIDRLALDLAPSFMAATGWETLTTSLSMKGLRFEPKGQGLVITDGHHEMKLSDLGRDIRLGELQKRFKQSWSAYNDGQRGTAAEQQGKASKPRSKPSGKGTHQQGRPASHDGAPSAPIATPEELAEAAAYELHAALESERAAGRPVPSILQRLADLFDPNITPPQQRPLVSEADIAVALANIGLITKKDLAKSLDRISQEAAQRRRRGMLDIEIDFEGPDDERER